MAPPKKKEVNGSIMDQWGSMFKAATELEDMKSGNPYKIQPVSLQEFVTSEDYLNQNTFGGLSKAQAEYVEAMTDFENQINFAVLWVGKGGGKNFVSTVVFAYAVYKLLCMYNPHAYLQHNPSKAVTLISVAINAKQAKMNFFEPLSEMVRNAGPKAFKDFGFIPEKSILSDMMKFPKNIQVIAGNSSGGSLEGYDVLMALLDEIDDTDFHGIDKMLTVLRSSSNTRFLGKEKVTAISYSRYEGSNGMIKLLYETYKDHPEYYVKRYASWEFNPRSEFTEDSPAMQKAMRENPIKAKTIYASDPGDGYLDSWIRDAPRIKSAMRTDRKWILDIPVPPEDWKQRPEMEANHLNEYETLVPLNPYRLPIKEYGKPGMKYVFCGDPGLADEKSGGDGYGITLAHKETIIREDGNKYSRPVIDFSFRFTGNMFKEGQVQMIAVEKLIDRLVQEYGYDIKIFSFDGWNSASTTQHIARTYPKAIVYTRNIVETRDYTALRDAIYGEAMPSSGEGERALNGGIDMPYHPILYFELKELREDRTKNPPKIDHTDLSTKDIADTLAKAVRIITLQWPYQDMIVAGIDDRLKAMNPSNRNGVYSTDPLQQVLASKFEQQKAQEQNKQKISEIYQDKFGLGKFRK